ncbi:MAG: hypothetical protein ACRC57_05760, partial [Sarcina sp.]
YTIEKEGTVSVGVKVEGADGKLTTFNGDGINGILHVVDTNIPGTVATGTGIEIPAGYHLVKTTINDKDATAKDVANVKVPDGNTNIIYIIAKNPPKVVDGIVTSKVVTSTGKVVVTQHNVNGPNASAVGDNVPAGGLIYTPNKGWKVTKVTVDGKDVTPSYDKTTGSYTIPGMKVTKSPQHIVWTVAQEKGNVTDTVKTEDGTIVVPTKTTEGTTGDDIASTATAYTNVPGYHVVGLTVNGETVKPNKDGKYEVPAMKYNDGTQNVVWTVAKNAPTPVKKYTTKITVTTPNGTEVPGIPAKTVETPAGDTVTGTGITVPKGYKIVKVTVDNKPVEPIATTGNANVPAITHTEANHTVHYTIEKEGTVSVGVKVEGADGKLTTFNGDGINGTLHVVDTNLPGTVATGTGIEIPAGYHLVKTTINDKDATAKDVANVKVPDGNTNIIYIIAKNPPKVVDGIVTSKVVTSTGKVVVTQHNVNGPNGSVVGDNVPASGLTYTPNKGWKVTKVTVDGNEVTPSYDKTTGSYTIPGMKVTKAPQHIVWTVTENTPAVVKGKVWVKVVNDTTGQTVVDNHMVDNGNVGETATGTSYTPTGKSKIAYVTVNGTKVPLSAIPHLTITDGNTNIVYHLENPTTPPTPAVKTGKVWVKVVNDTTGQTVVDNHMVDNGNVGETATGTSYTPTGKSKIAYVTVNGTKVPLSAIPHLTIADGNTNIVYHLENPAPVIEHGNVTDTVQTTDGTIVVPTKTTQGVTGDNISAGATAYTNVPGYHVVGLTVNGTSVQPNANGTYSVPAMTYNNGTQKVVWIVAKDQAPKPEVNKGNVTIEVKTTTGEVLVPTTTVGSGDVGSTINSGLGYNPIKGYHLVGTTVDGVSEGDVSISKVTLKDGTIKIVYTVAKDQTTPVNPPTPVVKTGSVTVKVVNTNGQTVVGEHTVDSGNVGNAVTGDGYTPENGNKIVKITVNGVSVKSLSGLKITDGVTHIVYTIGNETPVNPPTPAVKTGSVTVKVVNTNGQTVVGEHTVDSGNVGDTVTGDGYTPENGNKIIKITVNGVPVKSLSGLKITDGVTHIVYTIGNETPVNPPTPVIKTGSVTIKVVNTDGQTIVGQHTVDSGNVGDTVTGDGYTPEAGNKIIKITVNGIPVKSLSGLKITDGVTHIVYTIGKNTPDHNNGGTTTPGQGTDHNNGGTTTPGQGTDHNNGGTTTPDHGTDHNNGGTTTPGQGTNHNNGGTTSSNDGINQNNDGINQNNDGINQNNDGTTSSNSTNNSNSSNSGNTIPLVTSNNHASAKVATLPDTGLNNSKSSKTADEAAGIAGLLGALGLALFLRKKK